MKKIESVNNQYIKDLYKLHEKKYRDISKKFLVEGEHLVIEAYKTGYLDTILISDSKYSFPGVECIYVTEEIIKKLAHTKTPQKIIGVCKYLNFKTSKTESKFLLLDDIQDPGNLGTLVRSSLGFNIDRIYLSKESVDIYNDKFLRSSGGAVFHTPIEVVDLYEKIIDLKNRGIEIFVTAVDGGVLLEDIKTNDNYAIILGNEGSGVKSELFALTTKNIYIKTNPKLESLNVAIAGSIILYYLNSKKS
ncbi:MAG TPA: RNA methyltransferase [Gallicola sp.]|jgi:TrmH family RNA methyltransferase|nr:RNA methyltransferase [Gallicola sp.]